MFEGWYFKVQKDDTVLAFIPGRCDDMAFIQVITKDRSYHFDYPLSEYRKGETINVGNNVFSKNGIKVHIGDTIQATIKHENITPIKYHIMGPFQHFPMQCRHDVISMSHRLSGSVTIDGQMIDLTDGVGYMEADSGRSFPKNYLWLQCNDFCDLSSIMLSVAHVPFMGFQFMGCICVIMTQGKEYRLATYLGVKVIELNKNKIILKQGDCILEVDIKDSNGQSLFAPQRGKMTRIIKECLSVEGQFKFYKKGEQIFHLKSKNVCFEFVPVGL